ncbi:MAG TPA: alkaline phosphatase family protein [Myxococcales bacterium]
MQAPKAARTACATGGGKLCGDPSGPLAGVCVGCLADGDCASGFCTPDTHQCLTATCTDGYHDGDETGVDCGGPTCLAEGRTCGAGQGCQRWFDCSTGLCLGGICVEVDFAGFEVAPHSCAYDCPNDSCGEQTTPYLCPAAGAWSTIPHRPACSTGYDGTAPVPVTGGCSASVPSGEALLRSGEAGPGGRVLPGGRVAGPAGAEWQFQEGGETHSVAAVPGTGFVIAVDSGFGEHVVRAVDTTRIGAGNPVVGLVRFAAPASLADGVAFVFPNHVFVATNTGIVQALDLDLATGALARDDAASLNLPPSAVVPGQPLKPSSLAASPDGTKLVVGSALDPLLLVFDVTSGGPASGTLLGQLDLGQSDAFSVAFDPHDPTGRYVYVSLRSSGQVVEVDVSAPASPRKSRTFMTDKAPQGVAFLDARWMAVGNDLGETISVVDRTLGTVGSVPVDFGSGLRGLDVSALGWDEPSYRLYATLAGINAVAAFSVDLRMDPPAFLLAGRLPTSWWPSGLLVNSNGSLTVVNQRGQGIGPRLAGNPEGAALMKSSVQQIPAPSAADLVAGEVAVAANLDVGARVGAATVACGGVANDFPVPATNVEGPSKTIQHVFFVVREGKTFDSLLGDLAGADGDPSLTSKLTTAEMDQVWPNVRELARAFAVADNAYSPAVSSAQGHLWTAFGRTTGPCERTADALPPATPICGLAEPGRPVEGSLFDWLRAHGVTCDILGEAVGAPLTPPAGRNPVDAAYPGGPAQNDAHSDLEKACHVAGRLRVACDLGSFTYLTLSNDRPRATSPATPTADTRGAVSDEAVGLLLDALSHSPEWATSLVVIAQSAPAEGYDHVDYQRTPLLLVSPWVKRGYVSKTNVDVASVYKLLAHVFGLPYPNVGVQNAGLPVDLFTSTPDYTPYLYGPHRVPLACGP